MEDRYIQEKTILQGKYLIEKVLGEGGFGITYLATDLNLQRYVAIKEYCPREFASRSTSDGLTIRPFNDEESQNIFEREKEKYIEEARRLAKFYDLPGVVSVLDFFTDYGTSYLVMDYIDGETLSQYMKRNNGPMSVRETLRLMKPVMESLAVMHKEGIVHRDISPDNIMINKSLDKVYLIDFGTARSTDIESNRSLSVYKKGGFTPLEQQSTHGNQGPWTDVYELCATIYKCITGRVPQEAVDRVVEDELLAPSACGALINASTEQVIMDGLAVRVKERIQSMDELARRFKEADEELNRNPILEQRTDVDSVTVPVKQTPKPLPKMEPQAKSARQEYGTDEILSNIEKEIAIMKPFNRKVILLSLCISITFIVAMLYTVEGVGTSFGIVPALLVLLLLCLLLCLVIKLLSKLDLKVDSHLAFYGKSKNTSELQAQTEIYMMRNGKRKKNYVSYKPWALMPVYVIKYYNEVLLPAENVSEETKREWEQVAREKGLLK